MYNKCVSIIIIFFGVRSRHKLFIFVNSFEKVLCMRVTFFFIILHTILLVNFKSIVEQKINLRQICMYYVKAAL